MVAPTVNVLRQLATSMHEEIGSRQGSKHSNPNIVKDIHKLMHSLDDLDVYRYKEGRVLDDDEKPVPDSVSTGLAALSHGTGTNPLAEFNASWATACARRKLVPVSALLSFLDLDDPLSDPALGGPRRSGSPLPTPDPAPSQPSSDVPSIPPLATSTLDTVGLTPCSADIAPTTPSSTLAVVETSPRLLSEVPMDIDMESDVEEWVDDDGSGSDDSSGPGSNEGNESGSELEDGLVGVDDDDVASDIGAVDDGWVSEDELGGGIFDGGVDVESDGFVGADDDTDRSDRGGWESD